MLRTLLSVFLTVGLALGISSCTTIIGATNDGPIKVDPGKRTLGVKIDDEQIETIAAVNIDKASASLKNAPISVHSYNAVVLLTGQVPTEQARKLAGQTVRKLPNVRQVHNELQVQAPISLLADTNDAWLTTKIKTKLLAKSHIESARVEVTTENNTVFLMGLVTHAESKIITDIASHTRGVQKVVRVFEYID